MGSRFNLKKSDILPIPPLNFTVQNLASTFNPYHLCVTVVLKWHNVFETKTYLFSIDNWP